MVSPSDKRKAPRVSRHLIVRYRAPEHAQEAWRSSPLLDLSSGGARFRSERRFAPGTILEMQLVLPAAAQPVSLKARVAWTGLPQAGLVELGVTFATDDLTIQRTIDEAVAHFLRKQGV